MNPFDKNTAYALSNALALMAVGFVFAFFSLPFMGIDLLIDAVGWLLVFNGVRVLERPNGGIGPAALLCLGLVLLSALQLFTTGLSIFFFLHTALQIGLYILLTVLFKRLFSQLEKPKAAFSGVLIFGFSVFLSVISLVFYLYPISFSPFSYLILFGKATVPALLLWFRYLLR